MKQNHTLRQLTLQLTWARDMARPSPKRPRRVSRVASRKGKRGHPHDSRSRDWKRWGTLFPIVGM